MKTTFVNRMTARKLCAGLLLSITMFGHPAFVRAETLLYEDFTDTSLEDGNPATWTPLAPWTEGEFALESGDLVLRLSPDSSEGALVTGVSDLLLSDTSMRAQIRLGSSSTADGAELGVRANWGSYSSYMATIDGSGKVSLHRTPLESPGSLIGKGTTTLKPFEHDITFQLDAIGETIRVYAWPSDQSMPIQPLIEVQHDDLFEGETFIDGFSLKKNPIIYRFVQIANSPINDPGDFNGDRRIDSTDIDALSAAVRNQSRSLDYDLNHDRSNDQADRIIWVQQLKHTYFGDANLDGEFNSRDFVTVFTVGKYETGVAAGWGEGDWDGDGVFASSDFVVAFRDGGYEQGQPPAAVSAVPEPTSCLLMALGMLGIGGLRRRRG